MALRRRNCGITLDTAMDVVLDTNVVASALRSQRGASFAVLAMAALDAESYIQERAQRASRTKFLAAMAKVPDVEAPEHDRL